MSDLFGNMLLVFPQGGSNIVGHSGLVIYRMPDSELTVVLGKQWLHPEMTEKLLTGTFNQYTSEAVAPS